MHGTTINRSTDIPTPSDPAWSPATNPNSIPASYTISTNTTLPGGVYWFTDLTINANLSFSGPATIFVNGDVAIGGRLYAYQQIPVNLRIFQLGTGRSFGDIGSNGMDVIAYVVAPGSDFVSKNNVTIRGSVIYNSITAKNNAEFYYDETAGSTVGTSHVYTVQ